MSAGAGWEKRDWMAESPHGVAETGEVFPPCWDRISETLARVLANGKNAAEASANPKWLGKMIPSPPWGRVARRVSPAPHTAWVRQTVGHNPSLRGDQVSLGVFLQMPRKGSSTFGKNFLRREVGKGVRLTGKGSTRSPSRCGE